MRNGIKIYLQNGLMYLLFEKNTDLLKLKASGSLDKYNLIAVI